MLQAARMSLIDRVSDKKVSEFLKTEVKKVNQLAEEFGFSSSRIISHIPLSKAKLMQQLGFDITLEEEICCPECFKLYPIPEIPKSDDESLAELKTTCTSIFYSESKKYLKTIGNEVKFCDAKLMDIEGTGKRTKIYPTRTFSFQKLKNWLSHKLWLPGFEFLLDSNLKNENTTDGTMKDVWDGSVWKTLVGPANSNGIYTSKSGNLVFSLYVDWFNPYGNKSGGKSVSLGAVALVCLNLPLAERYKIENMFLFGVIPGPTEPKLDQMNHVLEPLISEMKEFWRGVWFTKTHQFPQGRLIFAAIFPLIGDLPAIRKTGGFSSHAATQFCSFCEINLQDINIIDINQFTQKTHEAHMERVQRWEGSDSFHMREKIAKLEGARGSILNELPYWRSVEHCGIEVMHNLLLGNLKDHSFNILKTYQAGKDLKKRVELEKKWKKKDSGKELFKGLKFPEIKRKKTPDGDSSGTEDEGMGGGKRRLLSSKNLSRLSRIEEDPTGPLTHNYRLRGNSSSRGARSATRSAPGSASSLDTQSSNPTVRRYELRRRSPISTSSLGSGSQFEDEPEEPHQTDEVHETEDLEREGITVEMEEGPTDEPRMKKEELRALQNVISQTKIPTWVSRVPHNFGMAGAGSLKAADWLILYTVYYPLAIVPYWVIGDDKQKENITGSKTVTHQDVLRDSLIKLIEITNILMKHQLNTSDITNYSKLIVEYRQTLQTGWPKQDTKANLHLSQHYPVVIERLGPPMATAAWAQERLNGMLGKIPNNHHMGMFLRSIFGFVLFFCNWGGGLT
jgi:hypothetical protein